MQKRLFIILIIIGLIALTIKQCVLLHSVWHFFYLPAALLLFAFVRFMINEIFFIKSTNSEGENADGLFADESMGFWDKFDIVILLHSCSSGLRLMIPTYGAVFLGIFTLGKAIGII